MPSNMYSDGEGRVDVRTTTRVRSFDRGSGICYIISRNLRLRE